MDEEVAARDESGGEPLRGVAGSEIVGERRAELPGRWIGGRIEDLSGERGFNIDKATDEACTTDDEEFGARGEDGDQRIRSGKGKGRSWVKEVRTGERRDEETGRRGGGEEEAAGAGEVIRRAERKTKGNPGGGGIVGIEGKGLIEVRRDVVVAVDEEPRATTMGRREGGVGDNCAPVAAYGGGADKGSERELGEDDLDEIPAELRPSRGSGELNLH